MLFRITAVSSKTNKVGGSDLGWKAKGWSSSRRNTVLDLEVIEGFPSNQGTVDFLNEAEMTRYILRR